MNEKYSDGVDLMQQLWGEAWDPEHVENDANDSAPRDVISQGAEEYMKNSQTKLNNKQFNKFIIRKFRNTCIQCDNLH